MFDIGDNVVVDGNGVRGVIVDFYYDEGNTHKVDLLVWVVEVDGYHGVKLECADDELTPATIDTPLPARSLVEAFLYQHCLETWRKRR